MSNRRLAVVAAAAALGLVLSACGGSGNDAAGDPGADDPGTDSEAVTLVATEFAFDPPSLELPADTPVAIVLDNRGVIEHDWTVDEVAAHVYAAAGASTTATVTLPAGTYTFYCSIPGHRASGMEGTVTAS